MMFTFYGASATVVGDPMPHCTTTKIGPAIISACSYTPSPKSVKNIQIQATGDKSRPHEDSYLLISESGMVVNSYHIVCTGEKS